MISANAIWKCVILCGALVSTAQGHAQVREPKLVPYSQAALKNDFAFLYTTIVQGHPGAFRFISPARFDSTYRALAAHIQDGENALQFKMHCDSLIAAIRCGHTGMQFNLSLSRQLEKSTIYTWAIRSVVLQNKWFIYKSLLKNDTFMKGGDEILSINSISSIDIINKTKSLIPADGYSTTSKAVHGAPYMPFIFMTTYWDHKDTLDFLLLDTLGHIKHDAVSLKSLLKADYTNEHATPEDTLFKLIMDNVPKKHRKSLAVTGQKSTLKIFKTDSSMALMYIPVFRGNSAFFARSFQTLADKKIKKLVIDLRGNPGGEISEAVQLLSYLLDTASGMHYKRNLRPLSDYEGMKNRWFYSLISWSFNKIYPYTDSANVRTFNVDEINPKTLYHFNGQCIVLINGGSFSAACIVASYLKNAHKAVFIGRESGGAQYGCNAVMVPKIKMPHTPLLLGLPLYSILYEVKDKGNGRGIMPDFPIAYSIQNILRHFDPDLNKALFILKSNNIKTQISPQ